MFQQLFAEYEKQKGKKKKKKKNCKQPGLLNSNLNNRVKGYSKFFSSYQLTEIYQSLFILDKLLNNKTQQYYKATIPSCNSNM